MCLGDNVPTRVVIAGDEGDSNEDIEIDLNELPTSALLNIQDYVDKCLATEPGTGSRTLFRLLRAEVTNFRPSIEDKAANEEEFEEIMEEESRSPNMNAKRPGAVFGTSSFFKQK